MYRIRIDGLSLVAVGFLLFFGFNIVRDQLGSDHKASASALTQAYPVNPSSGGPQADQPDLQATPADPSASAAGEKLAPAHVIPALLTPAAIPGDQDAIAFPYVNFIVTQGVHGAEYGQMAVDIAAGKGTPIKSPINGTVSALYVDEYGNPVLVLDNTHYTVMLYHGQYTVKVGDTVTLGTPVGFESNQGYTVDGFGRLCAGRDCGYHSHINVYDKQLGTNVNPLQVLQPATP
jgi:murein DD-endopeptidase MepM/ murein hydrolase activator NlpD